jgi:hypothetical protein
VPRAELFAGEHNVYAGRCWTDAAAKTKKCFAAPHSRAAANSLRCTSKGAYFFLPKNIGELNGKI